MASARPSLLGPALLFLGLAACAPEAGTSGSEVEELAATKRTSFVKAEVKAANAWLTDAQRAEKYAAMKASPFAFYRGTNHLYWKDFGRSKSLAAYGGGAETRVWLGGDMHVNNTGVFDDETGTVVFGVNDFDEAILADYQLDVWRMATSLVLVARENGGFSSSDVASVLDAFSEHYLDAMAAYAGNDAEVKRRFTADDTYGVLDDLLRDTAAKDSRKKMLDAWTVAASGVRRLDTAHNPDLAPVSAAVESDVVAHMTAYRATLGGGATFSPGYFTVKGVAARLHAGIGSLGSTRYYVLVEGATSGQDDDRILDVKAQRAPTGAANAAAEAVAATEAACGGNQALRAVLAYRALGTRVDAHLGWMKLGDGATYSVRERSPYKESLDTTELDSLTRLTKLAEQWGELLATHHARADQDWNASVVPRSIDAEIHTRTDGDHKGFRAKVRAIAVPYAEQVEADWASFAASF